MSERRCGLALLFERLGVIDKDGSCPLEGAGICTRKAALDIYTDPTTPVGTLNFLDRLMKLMGGTEIVLGNTSEHMPVRSWCDQGYSHEKSKGTAYRSAVGTALYPAKNHRSRSKI